MPKIEANGINIYYEFQGDGPPLVMIMGFLGNANTWDPRLTEGLSDEFEMLLFDNRGAGRTDVPKGEYSIELLAEDTEKLMDELEISSAHVFGISLGGMIAQELAINYPEKVQDLILASTFCGGENSILISSKDLEMVSDMAEKVANRNPADAEIMTKIFEKSNLATEYEGKSTSEPIPPESIRNVVKIAKDLAKEGGSWNEETARKLIPNIFTEEFIEENPGAVDISIQLILSAPTPLEGMLRQMLAVMNHDTSDRLDSIKSPTLVLAGAEDTYIPSENAEILADLIPNAELVYFEDSSHMLMEESDKVLDTVVDFLSNS